MTRDAYIDWGGSDERMIQAMENYGRAVLKAVKAVADYITPMLEQYAKEHAPWTDRTANARQSLHAWSEELAGDVVAVYLAHGVNYGKYLELRWQGRYAIIWPTIEQHLPLISRTLKEIFA